MRTSILLMILAVLISCKEIDRVPDRQGHAAHPQAAVAPGGPMASPSEHAYVVQDGDSLETISKKSGVDALWILRRNDLKVSEIKPGVRIILPDGVR